MKIDQRLFGIVPRHGYNHGRRVLRPALAGEVLRARWYSNYAILRHAQNKLSAVYARGGVSERHPFDTIINGRGSLDILEQRRLRRMGWAHGLVAVPKS